MVGKTIAPYEITAKIGESRRGVVYKARDPKMRFIGVSPEVESLHTTPGFQAILRRTGMPQYFHVRP